MVAAPCLGDFLGLGARPFVFTGSVLLHASTVYLQLGRWPMVYRDEADSSIILTVEWYLLVLPSLYRTLYRVPMCVACGPEFFIRRVLPPSTLLKQLALIAATTMCLATLIAVEPTGYVEWFLD